MNGERLPPTHGFPARLIVPGIYGMKNVKWLTKIDVVTGDFLGYCELVDIDKRHYRAELRFIVARQGWGQGYGLEVVRALLAHAASIGLKRLIARTHVGDTRAEKLLERLGFEAEGYLKGHIHRDGERRDCRLFGLLL